MKKVSSIFSAFVITVTMLSLSSCGPSACDCVEIICFFVYSCCVALISWLLATPFEGESKGVYPNGPTIFARTLMGGTISLATRSALITPMFLGRSSTKNSVMAVKKTALHFSAYVPKM